MRYRLGLAPVVDYGAPRDAPFVAPPFETIKIAALEEIVDQTLLRLPAVHGIEVGFH